MPRDQPQPQRALGHKQPRRLQHGGGHLQVFGGAVVPRKDTERPRAGWDIYGQRGIRRGGQGRKQLGNPVPVGSGGVDECSVGRHLCCSCAQLAGAVVQARPHLGLKLLRSRVLV